MYNSYEHHWNFAVLIQITGIKGLIARSYYWPSSPGLFMLYSCILQFTLWIDLVGFLIDGSPTASK